MPYDLLIYKEVNWKLITANYNAEIARINSKYTGMNLKKALSLFEDKVDNCRTYGDIFNVYPSGTIVEAPSPNSKFYAAIVTTGNYETAKQYAFPLEREFQYERTLNDTTNDIYEYRIYVESAIYNFRPGEYFNLPVDASVLSKSTTEVNIRLLPLTHPNVISGELTAQERRDEFQSKAKSEIHNLERLLKRCRYRVQLENLPSGIKTELETNRWVSVTQAQLLPYLEDKLV